MGQCGVVAHGVFDGGTTVEAQAVGVNTDATGVGLAGLDGVVEDQRRAAGTGCVTGLDRCAANVKRQLRCAGHDGVLRHIDRDAEHVASVECAVLNAVGRAENDAADSRRDGVHQVGHIGAECEMTQGGIVAGGILERSDVASTVQTQTVGGDTDAVVVDLPSGNGVAKEQRGAGAARDITGLHGFATDLERQLRCAGDGGGLAHGDRGADGVAGFEGTAGRAQHHTADAGRNGFHLVRVVVNYGAVGQRGGIAGGVAERATVGGQAVGRDADAVAVGEPARDGVIEQQRGAAAARGVIGIDRAATDVERQARRAPCCDHAGCLAHGDGDTEHVTVVEQAADHAGR